MIYFYAGLEKFFSRTKARKSRGGAFVSVPVKGMFLSLKTALDGIRLRSIVDEEFYKKIARFSLK